MFLFPLPTIVLSDITIKVKSEKNVRVCSSTHAGDQQITLKN